jgi:hypothetical protein
MSPMVQNRDKTKKNKTYNCDKCDYHSHKRKDFMKHCSTKKHGTKWVHPYNNGEIFYKCEKCDYINADSSEISNHVTIHSLSYLSVSKGTNIFIPTCSNKKYTCNLCERVYKYSSGLYRHQKTCIHTPNLMNLLIETTKNNSILYDKINAMECKQTINQTIHNNTNMLNVNLYLNNECKNAMNINDFVDKIKLTMDDLLYSQQHGYIKGITNIFVKNLEDLDPYKRPIHSIIKDKQKRQFYVKEGTEWKQDKQEVKIDQTIDGVAKKQILKIKEWESLHPLWISTDQGIEDYLTMIQTIMGGGSNSQERTQNRNMIKQQLVDNIDIHNTTITR